MLPLKLHLDLQQHHWRQCNGGCSRYHGDSATEDAADITGIVQWRMQWISWRQCNGGCSGYHGDSECNGGCSGYHGDSAMEDVVDIMRWVETTEDEDCIWKKCEDRTLPNLGFPLMVS